MIKKCPVYSKPFAYGSCYYHDYIINGKIKLLSLKCTDIQSHSLYFVGFLFLFLRSVLSLLNTALLKIHYAALSGPRCSYAIHALVL